MSIKTFKVTIKTIGPVHIGFGQTIKKQDYIYDFHNSKVHMVTGHKLMRFLRKKGLLQSYQEFLRTPPRNPRESGLKNYLDMHNIKQNEWNEFIAYTEKVNQGKRNGNQKPKPLNDIQLMVRDGQNKVYIPGSSIKGMLKTILSSKFDDENNKEKYSKLKVSDSLPIDEKWLAIYQKVDINKVDKSMPLYRECVDVGAELTTTLSIEDDVYSIEEIEDCIKQWYKNYYDKWLKGFKETQGGRRFALGGGMPEITNKNIIYLGAGTGFTSKTTHYQTKDRIQARKDSFYILRKNFYKVYGKFKNIPENVPVALKGTVNQSKNEWYQQGMCEITFNNINQI